MKASNNNSFNNLLVLSEEDLMLVSGGKGKGDHKPSASKPSTSKPASKPTSKPEPKPSLSGRVDFGGSCSASTNKKPSCEAHIGLSLHF
ncbi:MAG: hypothetical protein HQK49_18365 [Oligoflexia bacterium]|nr:hypothetical protein [Oligoflexia bacterium]